MTTTLPEIQNRDSRAQAVARLLLYAPALVPAVILPGILYPYVTVRTVFFRTAVDVCLALLVFLFATREYVVTRRRDWFLIGLGVFTAVTALAAVFGPSPNRSFFGDFERMGGVWSILHYLLYYAFARVFFGELDWQRFFRASAVVGAVLSIIGIAQYATANVSDITAVSSLTGNPGFLAMYLFFALGFTVLVLARGAPRPMKIFWLSLAALHVIGILLTQNRTTLLAIGVAQVIGLVVYSLRDGRRRGLVTKISFAVAAILLVIVILARTDRGGPVARMLPPFVSRIVHTELAVDGLRQLLWKASLDGFADRPLLGYGPENYHLVWSANFPAELYRVGADARIDRAHNAFLEALSTSGILGALAFTLLLGALFTRVAGALRSKAFSSVEAAVIAGLAAGYAVYLVFWFIDINSVLMCLALAAWISSRTEEPLVLFGDRVAPTRRSWIMIAGGTAAILGALYLHTFQTLRVARALHRSQERPQEFAATMGDFEIALTSSVPQTSNSALMLGFYLARNEPRLHAMRASPTSRSEVDSAFKMAFSAFSEELLRDPRNENLYAHEARVALLAARVYRNPRFYRHAVERLEQGVALNPRRIQNRLFLAYVMILGMDYEKARSQLQQALTIYAGSGQVHYHFATLELAQENPVEAAAALHRALSREYVGARSLYVATANALEAKSEFGRAAELLTAYLAAVLNARAPAERSLPFDREDSRIAARLPDLWTRAGDPARAASALEMVNQSGTKPRP